MLFARDVHEQGVRALWRVVEGVVDTCGVNGACMCSEACNVGTRSARRRHGCSRVSRRTPRCILDASPVDTPAR